MNEIHVKQNFIFILIFCIISFSLLAGCMQQKPAGNAPDFTLKTFNGNTFTLSNHIGKVVVIDFMATWCGYCKWQMDELTKVKNEIDNNIVIISIDADVDESEEEVRGTFGDYVDKWIFAMDTSEENVAGKYQVSGLPKIIIVDVKGDVFYSSAGVTYSNILIDKIQAARNTS